MRRVILAAMAAVLLPFVASPSYADWGDPRYLTQSGTLTRNQTAVVANQSGDVVAAGFINTQVWVARMPRGATKFAKAKKFNTSSLTYNLSLAVDAQGRACVAWQESNAQFVSELYASCFKPGGGWSKPKKLSGSTLGVAANDLVMVDGVATFVWSDGVTKTRRWVNGTWQKIKALAGVAAVDVVAAVAGNGRITLVEEVSGVSNVQVALRTSKPGGGWSARKLLCANDEVCLDPTIALSRDGSALVGFKTDGVSSDNAVFWHRSQFGSWTEESFSLGSTKDITVGVTGNGVDDVFDAYIFEYDNPNDTYALWNNRRTAAGNWTVCSCSIEFGSTISGGAVTAQMDRRKVTTYTLWTSAIGPVRFLRTKDGINSVSSGEVSPIGNTMGLPAMMDSSLRGSREIVLVWADEAPSELLRTRWAAFRP